MTRLSHLLLPTEREPPADAEALSHKLMVRAGLVRQLGAGLWTWLPAGWRVHQKVVRIVREEIDAIGAPGDADAGPAARRAVAPDGALRDRRAVQAQGPQGRRHGPRDDARGVRHDARRAGRALLPRPAAAALPLPDQGARRAAPARRRAAHARVRHEGRLQLRPRRGRPAGELRALHRGLRPDLRAHRAGVVQRRVRRRDDGRLRRARVHGAVRGRRERRRARARLRGQRRGRERRPAARRAARRRWPRRSWSTPRARRRSTRSRGCSACPRARC